MTLSFRCLFALTLSAMTALAQSQTTPSENSNSKPLTPATSQVTPTVTTPSDYVLGGGDQLQIDVPDLSDEFTSEKVFRIDGSGDLGLPYAGHVQAAGLTIAQLEESVKTSLSRILKSPDVTITIMGFGSQPASVLGAVNTPGIVQIAGHKNLFEVLSLAGGPAENAGYEVTITREIKWGPIPLPDSHLDTTGLYTIASVKMGDLLSSASAVQNLLIMPNDKISVPASDLVYAVGNVTKPGGFLLNQHESLSALQVVSLAEGFTRTAAPQRARILRVVPGSTSRAEIQVDLTKLIAGKIPDFQLLPQDILFVPNSGAKSTGFRALDAITAASGAGIYAATRF